MCSEAVSAAGVAIRAAAATRLRTGAAEVGRRGGAVAVGNEPERGRTLTGDAAVVAGVLDGDRAAGAGVDPVPQAADRLPAGQREVYGPAVQRGRPVVGDGHRGLEATAPVADRLVGRAAGSGATGRGRRGD